MQNALHPLRQPDYPPLLQNAMLSRERTSGSLVLLSYF